MIILDIQQNTPEWEKEKLGKPSASRCSEIITNDGKPSKQKEGYLQELAGELVRGKKDIQWKNACTEQGQEREQEAVDFFCMTNDCEIERVGIVYPDEDRKYLCSPDGIIKGKKEGFECKNPLAKTHVKYLLDGGLPSTYFGQIQFSLLVTGFKVWHFLSYVDGMRPLHVKVARDEKFIKALQIELELFCKQLDEVTERIR